MEVVAQQETGTVVVECGDRPRNGNTSPQVANTHRATVFQAQYGVKGERQSSIFVFLTALLMESLPVTEQFDMYVRV